MLALDQNRYRKQMLAKVHIAKKELGLDEDTYRMILKELTGKDSCKHMKYEELDTVLQAMYLLGFSGRKKLDWKALQFHKDGMIFHIENLAKIIMGSRWRERLNGYIRKKFSCDSIHFLSFKQLCSVFAFLRLLQKQTDPF